MIVAPRFLAALALASLAPGAAGRATPCARTEIATFPIAMHGLQPMTKARINGTDIDMLADSGAFYTTITSGTAQRLGLKSVPANAGYQMRGVGGGAYTAVTSVRDLTIGTLRLGHHDLLVGGNGVADGGLLGQNILGRRDTDYDLAGGAIRMIDPHGCDGPPDDWAGRTVSTIRIENVGRHDQHIIGRVIVNGVTMRAIFDTGAMVTVLTREAAAKAGVTPASPGAFATAPGRGVGDGQVRTWIGRFDSVRIGDEQARSIGLRFAEIAGVDFDLLVGADFFLAHRIYVSNARHLMHISPNKRMAPPPAAIPQGAEIH